MEGEAGPLAPRQAAPGPRTRAEAEVRGQRRARGSGPLTPDQASRDARPVATLPRGSPPGPVCRLWSLPTKDVAERSRLLIVPDTRSHHQDFTSTHLPFRYR